MFALHHHITITLIVIFIFFSRFVCGISIGAISAAIPIYISEVAHPSLRGTLSCIIILGVNFGMFIAAFFGKYSKLRIQTGVL